MFSIPFTVEKSEIINKKPAEVFQAVADFGTWRGWSPWLCQEPQCPVAVEGVAGDVGHSQAWDGDFIGSGDMRLSGRTKDESLDYDLTFLKPWKSKSKVGFKFAPKGEQTEITWNMRGTLPVFLFFMKKMMTVLVGSDYSRGLSMLKEHLETGAVPTKTEVKGVVEREGFHYIGKRRSCKIADIGPAMEEDFTTLGALLDESKLPKPEHVFSIYHKFDMVGGWCEYTSGFLYDAKPETQEDLAAGQLPAHKALQVNHLGPYRHLGNAWSAAMGCSRAKHKMNKSVPMYEIYPNSPREVDENDLQVEIYVPVNR